jgi:hypothetical protein
MAVTLCGPDCTPSPTEDEQIVAILKGGRFLRAENFDEECVMRIFGFTLERSKQYSFWRTRQGLSDVEAVVNEVASGLGEHLALLPFPGESVFRIDLDYRLHRKQKDDESINDTKNDDKSDKLIDNNDYYDRLINDTKYKNMVGLSGTEKEQLKQSGQIIRMNEFLAIYLIMYALSMIVRYYPEKWEQMLLTEVGYIIEGFVKSAPVTFLRYYRNLLDGECWMVSPR